MGTTIGSFAPGIGTAIGWAGELIYQGISDWLGSDEAKEIAPPRQDQKPVEVDASLNIGLAPGLVVQSQNMAASGGNVRWSVGNINTDAPS
jgi:hypothetical protein